MIMALRQAEMLFLEVLVVLPTPVRRHHRQALEGEVSVETRRYEISEMRHLAVIERQTDGAMENTIVETVDPLLRVVELQLEIERTRGIEV